MVIVGAGKAKSYPFEKLRRDRLLACSESGCDDVHVLAEVCVVLS